jgi:hypothetical protein
MLLNWHWALLLNAENGKERLKLADIYDLSRGVGSGGAAAPPKMYKGGGGAEIASAPQQINEFTQFTINAVKFETESI